eukprot:3515008-Amphidinium_carterae.2
MAEWARWHPEQTAVGVKTKRPLPERMLAVHSGRFELCPRQQSGAPCKRAHWHYCQRRRGSPDPLRW